MADDKTKRRKAIDDAVDKASAPGKKKQEPKPKNPYPKGSARYKLWERREAEKKKNAK